MTNHNKIYTNINKVMVGIFIYFMSLPIISPIMSRLFPSFWVCPYLEITGKPCPFCGITRDFDSLFHLQFQFINPLSIFMFCFVIFELIFRIVLLLKVKKYQKKLALFDILIHTLILGCIAIYVIVWLVHS